MVTWVQVSTVVKALFTTALTIFAKHCTPYISAFWVFSDSVIAWPCPNILFHRIPLSDNMFNLDLKYKKDFLSVEMEDQEEEQLVDSIGLLVCKEDLFSHSQLVELVNNPTQDPVLQILRRLQPVNFPWIEDVEAQDGALLEQSSEEQQGPRPHNLLHLSVKGLRG